MILERVGSGWMSCEIFGGGGGDCMSDGYVCMILVIGWDIGIFFSFSLS